jgi:hypothetical protein
MRTTRTHSMWNQARVLGGSAVLLLVLTLASDALAFCYEAPAGKVWEDHFPDFVNVYTATNHKGVCMTFPRGSFANLGEFGINDAIRSIKVGRNNRLRVFAGTYFSGDWYWWQESLMNLGRANDRASSLRVESRSIKPDCSNHPFNTVAIYEESDFRGDCRVLSPGCYDGAKEMGFENDSLSSISNKAGDVVLYPHASYEGCSNWWDCDLILYINEGEDYSYVGDDINDATTSICIEDHSR